MITVTDTLYLCLYIDEYRLDLYYTLRDFIEIYDIPLFIF